MVDTLEFLGILLTFAVILVWYLQNIGGGGGAGGLLALKDDPEIRERRGAARAYRRKPKYAAAARDGRTVETLKSNTLANPAYRVVEKSAGRGRSYRPRNEARYRLKSSQTPSERSNR